MIAIVAVSLCHIAAGVFFLNKLAPVRPQAPSQNGEQLSSQKTPKKTSVTSNENVASTRIGWKLNLSKYVKLHFSRFVS